jgi:hypothetical protein
MSGDSAYSSSEVIGKVYLSNVPYPVIKILIAR